ncbi:MAG TPA: efflux RND transporter periplasmic adaptor subunit [Parasegetibacter sp.]
MKRKSVINLFVTILAIAGVIALIGWVLGKNKASNEAKTAIVAQSNNSAVSVRITEAIKTSIDQNATANGNFAPFQEINFASEISGRITQVLVNEGHTVHKGQVLAIIRGDALNIDLESAQLAYQNAARDKERFENAFRTGGVTQQQLDQIVLAYENAAARLEQAKIKVGDTYVRASIDGIVNKRYIEPGAVVSPGTQLFELVNVSRLKLKVNVNEMQVARLKNGDMATVKASVFPDKEFKGKITFIAAKADQSLNFPVEIEVINAPGSNLKAGMYGTAQFNFASSEPVILIPRTAFVGSVSTNQVFIADAENVARLRSVISGRVLGDQVEILDGIKEGERVITSGQINLSDGIKISPIN